MLILTTLIFMFVCVKNNRKLDKTHTHGPILCMNSNQDQSIVRTYEQPLTDFQLDEP